MSRLVHFAVVLAYLCVAQLQGTARLVCGYTGEVMERCCCPERDAVKGATLDVACCCDLHSDLKAELAAEQLQWEIRPVQLGAQLHVSELRAAAEAWFPSSHQSLDEERPPPWLRLHLRECVLLV